MTNPTSTSQRRRGAQLGNKNALKHGFYARRVPELQDAALEALDTEFPGLEEEILVLRVYIRRMLEQSGSYYRLHDGLSVVRTLSLALATLVRLIREHRYLTANPTETQAILRQAREDIAYVEDPLDAFDDFADKHALRYGGEIERYLVDAESESARTRYFMERKIEARKEKAAKAARAKARRAARAAAKAAAADQEKKHAAQEAAPAPALQQDEPPSSSPTAQSAPHLAAKASKKSKPASAQPAPVAPSAQPPETSIYTGEIADAQHSANAENDADTGNGANPGGSSNAGGSAEAGDSADTGNRTDTGYSADAGDSAITGDNGSTGSRTNAGGAAQRTQAPPPAVPPLIDDQPIPIELPAPREPALLPSQPHPPARNT